MVNPEEISRRWFLRLLGGGTVALTLAGCGGGGNDDDNNNGGDPNALTGEQLLAAQNAIAQFTHGLPAQDIPAMQQAVLTYVQGRSEVMDSGLMNDGVWAMFKNGWCHVVYLNRAAAPLDPDDSDPSRAAGTGVPKDGTAAVLMNAMVDPGFADEAARIVPALSKAGYNPQSIVPAINTLRNIGTPNVFFYSSHGLSGTVRGQKVFLLTSSTVVTTAISNTLLADANAMRVFTGSGPGSPNVYYAISQNWVKQYWKFAPSSLVWLSACGSQSAEGQLMVQACLSVGAGAVAGYTDSVLSTVSDRIQRFMFDRLAGANILNPKEATPQRAFDYDKLLESLAKEIGNSFPVYNPLTSAVIPGKTVSLAISKGADNFGLLAPSIAYVLIDEPHDKAILKGTFGLETDGKVFIGGQEAAVEVWGADEIRCALARTGAGSAGDVYVEVRGHKSNVRRISRWTVTGTYKAQPDSERTLYLNGAVKLTFRADVGEYRQDPGKVFVRPTRYALATRDSSAEVTASGTHAESCGGADSTVYDWSGTQVYSAYYGQESGGGENQTRGILSYFSFDTINKVGAFAFSFADAEPTATALKESVALCGGGSYIGPVTPTPPSLEPVEMKWPTEEFDVALPIPGKSFAISGDWNIPAGSMTAGEFSSTFEWSAATAEFPPDPQASRRQK